MKQWEYRIIDIPLIDKYEQEMWLDNLGEEGWELCSVINGMNGVYGFFKREVIQ